MAAITPAEGTERVSGLGRVAVFFAVTRRCCCPELPFPLNRHGDDVPDDISQIYILRTLKLHYSK